MIYTSDLLNRILDYEKENKFIDIIELISAKTEEIKSRVHLLSNNELYERLGNKKEDAISSLSPLVFFINKYVDSNGVIYISQKVTPTNKIYGNSKRYNKWLHRLMQMECIYRLDIPFITDERAYYYYVCKPNFDVVLQWCLSKQPKDGISQELVETDKGCLLPIEIAPTFNASIFNIGEEYSDNDVIKSLHDNYPLLLVYQLLVNELNESIERKEEKIEFRPKVHRSQGRVSKISIRAYSPICNYPSFKNVLKNNPLAMPIEGVVYRESYLRERLGENYKEFDVKCSIARISHALNLWEKHTYNFDSPMGDLSEDVYRTIFESHLKGLEECFHLNRLKWEDIRVFFKKIFMKMFFGGSVSKIKKTLLDDEYDYFMENSELYNSSNIQIEDMPFHYANIKKILTKLIKQWKTAVEEYCDIKDNKSTEVFFDESCVYLEVRKILHDRGIDVVQVFDGFYFSEEVPQDIEEIFHQAFFNYVTKPNIHASIYAHVRSKITQ